MELDKAKMLKAIVDHNAFELEFCNERPKKGDILVKTNNNNLNFVLVKGFKNANQTLFIYDFFIPLPNTNAIPKFDNARYINTTSQPHFKCDFPYKLKYKTNFSGQAPTIPTPIHIPVQIETLEITIEKDIIPNHIKSIIRSTTQECPICYTDIPKDHMEITDCGHIFCKTCLISWLSKKDYNEKNNDDCPTCRKKII